MMNNKASIIDEMQEQLRILIDKKYETGCLDLSMLIQEEIEMLREKIDDLKSQN